jgi:hypothetical protein
MRKCPAATSSWRRVLRLDIRIQDIVDTRCIQHIVDNLNMVLENPHEIGLFETL